MNTPWLSVLIPTYNGEKYLASTLDSILDQGKDNYQNLECIAIDDGSTDSTLTILQSYQDKLPLKIIQRQGVSNWVANTNYALSVARGYYVCFLHQDDIWLSDRLLLLKCLIDRYPEVNLFLNPSQFIDFNGNNLGLWRCPLPTYPAIVDADTILARLIIQNFIAIPAPIFKREIAIDVDGLDERLWYTADWDFWLKITSHGKIMYYPKTLSAFRVHSHSQTVIFSSYLQDFRKQLEVVAHKYLQSWQVPEKSKKIVRDVAYFSIDVNISLAAMIHGKKPDFTYLFSSFLALGMMGWYRYFRYSRIWERVLARIKTKLSIPNTSY